MWPVSHCCDLRMLYHVDLLPVLLLLLLSSDGGKDPGRVCWIWGLQMFPASLLRRETEAPLVDLQAPVERATSTLSFGTGPTGKEREAAFTAAATTLVLIPSCRRHFVRDSLISLEVLTIQQCLHYNVLPTQESVCVAVWTGSASCDRRES